MALITAENRDSWQTLANGCAAQRPSVGKRVRVVSGRKHLGKEGTVKWHGVNRFYDNSYRTDAQLTLAEMRGREGYRVRVVTDSGEAFFIDAEKIEVIHN